MSEKASAPTLSTRVAAAGTDEHLYAGRRVFGELAGEASMASLCFLGVTGRPMDAEDKRVLDALTSCGTVADPRVWPMKVGRIVASYGNALSGSAAGLLALSSAYLGPWRTVPAAATLLKEVAEATADAEDFDGKLEELLGKRRFFPGFGVPFRPRDERLPPLRRCLEQLGRHRRPYFALMERLSRWTREARSLEPNFGVGVAAALLDLDVRVDEMGIAGIATIFHMLLANAHEGARQQSELLQRLPAEHLRYVGTPPRISPRARKQQP